MGKNDLLGGSLWDQYSNKVTTLMNSPTNQGEITQEQCDKEGYKLIVADFGAESCGDAVRLYWAVNPENDLIVNSKFKSFGCFASNTDVNTPTGIKKINKLAIGDKVITWNGKEITSNTIKEILIKEVDINEIQVTEFMRETGGKFKIITSKNHPFWNADNSMKIAGDIKVGDEMFEVTEHELRVITNIRHQPDFRKKISMQIETQEYVHNGIKVVDISNNIHGTMINILDKKDNNLLMYDLVLEENGNGHVYFTNRVGSHNCGTAIASSDMMAELCIGKTVQEAVKITNIDVEMALRDTPETPAVPPQKMHCSVMAYDVIKKAAGLYLGVDESSFESEIIVCECARVSLGTLKEVIKLNNLNSIEEITDYTKAGGFCKSCIKPGGHEAREWYLVDILNGVRQDMDLEKMQNSADSIGNDNFENMTLVKKIKSIDSVIDESIRQFLIADGGNVEIIDVKEVEEYIDIYIRYLGSCNGCSSSSTGTLYAIESTLREKLSEKIRVLPI